MPSIPHLNLTHGQVAWSLCSGRPPDRRTLDSLRYLRQLGVPFTDEELGIGRGNRLTYGFDHLTECAVAMYAIRRNMKPRKGAGFLVSEREALRQLIRGEFSKCPDTALDEPWVKSRGNIRPVDLDEYFIRLHERYADVDGKIEAMTMEEVITFEASLGDLVERYPDGVYPLVPLRRVVLEAVAWALVAPVTPPGRVASSSKVET